MKPPDTNDTAQRLWLRVFGTCLAVVATLLLWTVLTPPFQGDLTRIGRLSETVFGPNVQAPATDPALRLSSALDEADVLVIGDSFSAPLRWQAVLVAQGLKSPPCTGRCSVRSAPIWNRRCADRGSTAGPW